jgi:hypothetical protein
MGKSILKLLIELKTFKKMKYYIQNKDAGYLGNSIVFWGKNRRGYTANLDKAGQYSLEEAKEICQGNPDKNKAWSVNYIDENEGNSRVTDSQHLEQKNIVNFGDL